MKNDIEYGAAIESARLPITTALVALWVCRKRLLVVTIAGMLISACLGFVLPIRFSSTASIMPPESSALAGQSALSQLNGPGISLGASALTSVRTPASTVMGILMCRTEQDFLIDRFDLRRVYKQGMYGDARRELANRTRLDEDKKSGILSITVIDDNKLRAREIAQGYIDELNALLNTVNSTSSRKERLFLEQRLSGIKEELGESSLQLSAFSSRHATLNPQGQGLALIESHARLEDELTIAEAELSGLRATYSDENVRVKSTEARIAALRGQLNRMGAMPGTGSDPSSQKGVPSMRELPLVAADYAALSRQVATQQTEYEAVAKQLEIARLEEAKETPVVRELDAPVLAEAKASPHRLTIMLCGTFGAMLVAALQIIVASAWRTVRSEWGIARVVRALVETYHEQV